MACVLHNGVHSNVKDARPSLCSSIYITYIFVLSLQVFSAVQFCNLSLVRLFKFWSIFLLSYISEYNWWCKGCSCCFEGALSQGFRSLGQFVLFFLPQIRGCVRGDAWHAPFLFCSHLLGLGFLGDGFLEVCGMSFIFCSPPSGICQDPYCLIVLLVSFPSCFRRPSFFIQFYLVNLCIPWFWLVLSLYLSVLYEFIIITKDYKVHWRAHETRCIYSSLIISSINRSTYLGCAHQWNPNAWSFACMFFQSALRSPHI